MSIDAFKEAAAELSDGKFTAGDITAPAAAALGVLGAVADPAAWVVGQPLGKLMDFLLENCAILREPMDLLLGDVGEIMAEAQAWEDIAQEIINVGTTHAHSVSDLPSWNAPGSEEYKEIQRSLNRAFQDCAESARGASSSVQMAGQFCAAVREFVWGLVKDFMSSAIANALVAAAAAIPTAGGSVGAYIAWFQGKIAVVMGKISKRIGDLFQWLAQVTRRWSGLSDKLLSAAQYFRRAAAAMGRNAGRLSGVARAGSGGRLGLDTPAPHYSGLPEAAQKPAGHAANTSASVDKGEDANDGVRPAQGEIPTI